MNGIEASVDAMDLDQDITMREAPMAIEAPMGTSEQLFDLSEPTALAAAPDRTMQDINGSYDVDPSNGDGEVQQVDDVNNDVDDVDELQEDTRPEFHRQTRAKSRLYPIEVVLAPPPDPETYEKLSPSFIVNRVLEEIRIGNQSWYSVEYSDGRIDQVAYDDLLEQERGPQQAQAFWEDPRFAKWGKLDMGKPSKLDPRPEDNYSEVDSIESDSPPRAVPTRRNPSRQASADNKVSAKTGSFESSDDEDDGGNVSRKRKSRATSTRQTRQTRSRAQPSRSYHGDSSSADELSQLPRQDDDEDDDDGDAYMPVISDVKPTKKSSARKRKRPGRLPRKNDRGSSIEFEPTRRSGRTNRTSKSMRDPELDDEYEMADEKATTAPKYVAIKETFRHLPSSSEFRKFHNHACDICGTSNGRSTFVYCQGCSNTYHKQCIGTRSQRDHRVTKVAADEFVLQCKYCIGSYQKKDNRAPNYAACQVCKGNGLSCAEFSPRKTPKQEEKIRIENNNEDPITGVNPDLINNADNVLFRCSTCRRGYHFDHLPPLAKTPIVTEDIKQDRLDEYSTTDWKCKDCLNAQWTIHALVAWRPINQGDYSKNWTCLDYDEDSVEYLVKWDAKSHFHDDWMPGSWVFGVAHPAMRKSFYKRKENDLAKMNAKQAMQEEWLLHDVLFEVTYRRKPKNPGELTREQELSRIHDISSAYVKFQGLGYDEAVWDEPPPRDGDWGNEPWKAFRAAYEEYVNGQFFPTVSDHKMKERITQYRSLDFSKECELKQQPLTLQRGKLMEYQMEGVNWLLYNFHQQQNVILADEMGLGKTVQIVAFITALVHDKPNCWPFLIVVPNSTCPNWRRELKQWAPDLRVVAYHGGKAAQDLAYRYELYPDGPKGGMKAHVVIMSYEAATNAGNTFKSVKWTGLIVDEGQRLKNEDGLLYKALWDMKIPCRILLTGTPLQNNKRELFNLLQFIDPTHNAEELDIKYLELTKENLPELHDLIRPYFLRRTKAQVLKFLPPMGQIILPVTMTILQERLCRGIMSRNSELIKTVLSNRKLKSSKRGGLNNILSDLRQCLCHPFCFDPRVEDRTLTQADMHATLVSASAKLMLLNIMLPKLHERGHRVLIFSQYLRSLDILEDLLSNIGLQHARIDGNMSGQTKQKRIDAFNAPDSPLFAMLLSTRAGGVGINLATADTVIICDPDFNPHQDIQALSRAHRIGQKNKVLCFQLTTKSSVEEKIMQIGRKKMALDHALIESMDAADDTGGDVASALKHAAQALFGDNAKEKITYDDAAVDKLLDRSEVESTNPGDEEFTENQFSFARVWANDDLVDNADADADNTEPVSTSVWENILKQRELEHKKELAAEKREYGRGARRRGTQGVVYDGHVGFIEGVDNIDDHHSILTAEQQPQGPDSAGSDIEMGDELYIDNVEVEPDEDYESDGFQDPATLARSRQKGPKGTKRPAPKPSTPGRSRKRVKTVNTPSSNSKRPVAGGKCSIGEQYPTTDGQPTVDQPAVDQPTNGYPSNAPPAIAPSPTEPTQKTGETSSEQAAPDGDSATFANHTVEGATTENATNDGPATVIGQPIESAAPGNGSTESSSTTNSSGGLAVLDTQPTPSERQS